jgi:nucleoside phosphorylase
MKAIVDYLIVIPLDEEYHYIQGVIEELILQSANVKTIGSELYGLALIPTESGDASAVFLSVGRMTEAPIQSAVEAAVRTWRPAAVIMIGIAGSFEPDKIMLGDVIVPSKIFGFTEAKATVIDGKERTIYRPTGHAVDCTLTALARGVFIKRGKEWQARSYNAGLEDVHLKDKLLAKQPNPGPALHIGNNDCIASGNVVIASKAAAQKVREALGDAGTTVRAVEMEAKGLRRVGQNQACPARTCRARHFRPRRRGQIRLGTRLEGWLAAVCGSECRSVRRSNNWQPRGDS